MKRGYYKSKGNYPKKQESARIPFVMKNPPSDRQEAIRDAFENTPDNLHCEAVAGSGKSTLLKWLATFISQFNRVAYLAFNKAIVTEIEMWMPQNCQVATGHSFGYKALAAYNGGGRLDVNGGKYKVGTIIKQLLPAFDPDRFDGRESGEIFHKLTNAEKLVQMLKVTLTDPQDVEGIERLAFRYSIDLDDMDLSAMIAAMPKIMMMNNAETRIIDFPDMLYLPVVLNMNLPKFDILLVDECQDLSPVMIEFAKRMARRIITVGDRNQSIYGFAGADVNSIDKLKAHFNSTELPLDVCYRCGKKIIELAQEIVPHIKWWEGSPDGEIITLDLREYVKLAEQHPDMMALCRRNAPLVGPCFQLIKAGIKANIKGQDIGKSLASKIRAYKATDINDLIAKVERHREKQTERLIKKGKSTDFLDDECDVILAFADQCNSVTEISDKIESIFSEEQNGVMFSSMHKAKGLEANAVLVIDSNNMRISRPGMLPEDCQQEANLSYVSYTRPKTKLILAP